MNEANEEFLLATFFDCQYDETRAYLHYKNGINLLLLIQQRQEEDGDNLKRKIKLYTLRIKQLDIKHYDNNDNDNIKYKDKHQFCYGCRKWISCLSFPKKCKTCGDNVHTNCFYYNDAQKDCCGIHYSLNCLFDKELTTFICSYKLCSKTPFLDKTNEIFARANAYENANDYFKASKCYTSAIEWLKMSQTLGGEEEKKEEASKRMAECKLRQHIINKN